MEAPAAQPGIYTHPQPVESVRPVVPESELPDPEQSHAASVAARALIAEFRSMESTELKSVAAFVADISEPLPASDTQVSSPLPQTDAPPQIEEQLGPVHHSVFESYEPLHAGSPRKSFAERLRDVLPHGSAAHALPSRIRSHRARQSSR
jgi:hypothetical protein